MTVLEMTRKEFSRLEIIVAVEEGKMSVSDAASLMRLSRRQIFRLLNRFRSIGPHGVASQKRGAPPNNGIHRAVRNLAMMLVRKYYPDFGPTLACEKLREVHDCRVSRETLRKWMIEDGLWLDRRHKLPSVHQPRNRRARVGELIQIDGSTHAWFEDRGDKCTLIAFIDDATSRIQHAAFVPSESAFDYMRETRAYIDRFGRPIAFYSDKHAIFRVNHPGAIGGTGMTQFGRALNEINIDILCANTPSAKGRVERCFGTLQDRLVKELRLEGVSDMKAANAFLPTFIEQYNARFGKPPFDETDGHRPMMSDWDLTDVFAWKEERTVSNSLTLQYDKMLFLLVPNDVTRPLARKRVTVHDYPDGRIAIRFEGRDLPYRIFDKLQKVDQASVVDNKRLGAVLAYVAERQKEFDEVRSKKSPRRRGQSERQFV
ncbi:ISNCY family transposase [Rhodoblastus sp.]|uniref:ISNCY family transposase n=3 Tax=Rhodoblastus sp. TaxID=1962975 RepID=UPI003F9B8787